MATLTLTLEVLNRFRKSGDWMDNTSQVVGVCTRNLDTNQIEFWKPDELRELVNKGTIQLTNMTIGWDGSLRFSSNRYRDAEKHRLQSLYGQEDSEYSNRECARNIARFNHSMAKYLIELCGPDNEIGKPNFSKSGRFMRPKEERVTYSKGDKPEFLIYYRQVAFYNNFYYNIYKYGKLTVRLLHTYDIDRKTNIVLIQTDHGWQLLDGDIDTVLSSLQQILTNYINSLETQKMVEGITGETPKLKQAKPTPNSKIATKGEEVHSAKKLSEYTNTKGKLGSLIILRDKHNNRLEKNP